jgi:glutathione synthase/RimK-type ligase-like ATP-grasp enzyme
LRVLLIVAAKGGNIPTNILLDDHIFAVTALYAEYHDPDVPLPKHDIVFNAVGDADLCEHVLPDVTRIIARSKAPVVNRPEFIRDTGRYGNSIWLSRLSDVVVPKVGVLPKAFFDEADVSEQLERNELRFPLLLRSPGFHTGQHFLRADDVSSLKAAAQQLPGEELFVIEYFDVRGPDGLARKYRAMFIDGELYPLHLALSKSWKVHYFSSAMADDDAFRREEERFLTDMKSAIGARAIHGLEQVRDALKLDYGGIDFAVMPDGRLLLFEANATMAIVPPTPDAIWDYRRKPITDAIEAARSMLFERAGKP